MPKKEETLAITYERVEKVNSPLIVIGLGGTGCDIVREIKTTFKDRYVLQKDANGKEVDRPARTAYLCLDTDDSSKTGFTDEEFCHLQVAGLDTILKNPGAMQPYETAWVDPAFNTKSGPGAGTIRQCSRFLLSRCFSSVYNKFNDVLRSVLAGSRNDQLPGRLEVVICAGLCGGTGSGTFLDVPQIVRSILKTNMITFNVTGYLVLPDANFSAGKIDANARPSFEANAFAALKELDFWQRVGEHHAPYTIQYNLTEAAKIAWTEAPYDACILLSATMTDGRVLSNGMEEIQKTVAENLLHYLAAEKVTAPDGSDTPQYSYISHENNLTRLLKDNDLKCVTPLYHGYRAVGAYAISIPKRKMLAYETTLLMKTFMPAVSTIDGTLVVNTLRLDRNELSEAVKNAVPSLKERLGKFGPPLVPAFCKVNPSDRVAILPLQEATVKPHDRVNEKDWRTSKVYGEANGSAREYLELAWANLENLFREILESPNEGPYSLEAYLTDKTERGVLAILQSMEETVASSEKRASTDVTNAYKACNDTYADFRRPPVLGRSTALAAYMDSLSKYYKSVISEEFYKNYRMAFSQLINRVNMFVNQSLSPMCKDLLKLQDEFNDADMMKSESTDLVSMEVMRKRIDEIFEGANKDGKITNTYLTGLGKLVLGHENNNDPKSAYVTFNYLVNSQLGKYTLLKETLDDCYALLFKGSVDSLLLQEVNGDTTQLDGKVSKQMENLQNGAMPLFADMPLLSEQPVPFYYLSVPQDSTAFANYADNHKANHMTPKKSSINDRIYCLLTWDGLSLDRYSLIRSMEASYNNVIHIANNSAGMHLVNTRDKMYSSVANDWSRLPTPVPFYYMSTAPSLSDKEAFAEVNKLFARAKACGMIEVGLEERPVYTIRLFYTNHGGQILQSSDVLRGMVDDVLNMTVNSQTGRAFTDEEKAARLKAIRDDALQTKLQAACVPFIMKSYCGFSDYDKINPFDPVMASYAQSVQDTAWENYGKLCDAFGASMINADPFLLEKLQAQIDVFEYMNSVIEKLGGTAMKWKNRAEYGTTFARMILREVVLTAGSKYTYRTPAKQKAYVINDMFLEADLAQEDSELIRTASYLADRPGTDETRSYLEALLTRKEKQYDDAMLDDQLEKEDVEALIENCEALLGDLEDDLNSKNGAKLNLTGDSNLLDSQIAMLEGMKKLAEKTKRDANRTLRGMAD